MIKESEIIWCHGQGCKTHSVIPISLCLKYLKESFHKYESNHRRDE